MKLSAILTCAVAGGLFFAAQPADAFVTIYGRGQAYECYQAAKAGAANADKGIAVCDAALEGVISHTDKAGTYVNRGVLKYYMGDHDAAMADYEAGIRLNPTLGDAYVDRGAALITMKRYDDALIDINKGMELGLSYPFVGYYNRAVANFYLARFKESYYDYKKVLELNPDYAPAAEQIKNFTVTTTKAAGS